MSGAGLMPMARGPQVAALLPKVLADRLRASIGAASVIPCARLDVLVEVVSAVRNTIAVIDPSL